MNEPLKRTVRVSRRPQWWGSHDQNLFWAEFDDDYRETWKVWEPSTEAETAAAQSFYDLLAPMAPEGASVEVDAPDGATIRIGKPVFEPVPIPAADQTHGDPLLEALRTHSGNLLAALEAVEGQARISGKGITAVQLRYTKITDFGMAALAGLSLVTQLDLAPGLTDAAFVNLQGMSSLERLTIENSSIQGDGLKYLSGMKHLASLTMCRCEIGENAFAYLPDLPALTQLNLQITTVSDADLESIAKLTALVDLSLAHSKVVGPGLRFLHALPELKTLSLYYSPITDDGLSHISTLSALESLDLSGTQVGDAGIAHLTGLPKLSAVHLKATRVTDTAIPLLGRCPSLTFADVDETEVTLEGTKLFKKLRRGGTIRAVSQKRLSKTKPSTVELIKRPKQRKAAPVAKSWKRIEVWLKKHAPAIQAALRPPATEEALQAVEHLIGQPLPPDVRESYLIHDGQEFGGTDVSGVFFGMSLMSLTEGEGVAWCWQYRIADDPANFDENDPEVRESFTTFPEGAIRLARMRPGWIPLYWDSGLNFFGIDLEPGPSGVIGQVIPFSWESGIGAEQKYVLAQSWAHFLQDVADELEAGHAVVEAPEVAGVDWFYLKCGPNKWFWNAFPFWSKAKLPKSFQES